MPNNNNQPDINKAIDVCMEEYKTLRAEILQTIQNRTNVIVFGGGLVLTLVGIGISPIANLPPMKKITSPTPTSTSTLTPTPTPSTLVTTEEISPQNFYKTPIERRISSAIILGIMVPASCGLIIFLVNASSHQVVRIGRYIATNIEPKINDLYFKNLPGSHKPIIWETYMQTLRFGLEEGNWVKTVFGTIQLLGLAGAVFAVRDVIIANIIAPIIVLIVLFCIKSARDIILLMYFSIFTEKGSEEIAKLRDGEGSLQKIWYQKIEKQNKNVKATRIFWKKDLDEILGIIGLIINDKRLDISQIQDNSLKSKLESLNKIELANQVLRIRVNMQNENYDPRLLNQVIKHLFNYLLNENLFKDLLNKIKNYSRTTEYNPPFYFNLDNGGGKRINNILELLELCIDNPNNFIQHIRQQDFERWLDNIEIGETELANIAQATRENNFPNDNERLHYFLRECCLVLIEG